MAQVTHSVHQHIDIVLSHLLNAWQRLPVAIDEIDDWDSGEQIVYVEVWSPDEQLLATLYEHDQDEVLSTDQSARYQELLALVEKNHPLLDDLRESD